jgi:hypothetical protein
MQVIWISLMTGKMVASLVNLIVPLRNESNTSLREPVEVEDRIWWEQKIAPIAKPQHDYSLARAIERTFSIICKYLNLVKTFEASFIATKNNSEIVTYFIFFYLLQIIGKIHIHVLVIFIELCMKGDLFAHL